MHLFPDPVSELLEQIERALDQSTQLPADCPDRLRESMRYSLLAGGKRLRPVLTLLACRTCGTDPLQAMPAAIALEMVHTYSLIHDDLPAMDDDALRRGRPTNHVQFGEATAILAGDGLLTHAFYTITSGLGDSRHAAACCRELAEAAGATGMVGGQQADLEAETAAPGALGFADLLEIHRRKTGCLIRCALRMGAIVADASERQFAALTKYGEAIGLAFQIADDVLDRTGTQEKMGKQVAKDDSHSKLTFPALLGLDESRARAEQLVADAIAALDIFENETTALRSLARYSIVRDH
ncbi:polyprenyl synthetase family protein [Rubinisphaera margarita]|uniref:polyprenyl synthetase family protein n=1 Tax=Rubinisphaera margarita TaxID=2909586 RepID=UPI001EE9A5B0|nr:farnesyl diphosphate synthase [Rubinisphaera margarita]MCG6154333.1 polyprenyl synthetase family protein [Rubinisphaera margarita]